MRPPVPTIAKLVYGEESVDINYYLTAAFDDIREAAESIPAIIGHLGYHKGWCMERLINAERAWKISEAKAYFALRGGQFVARGFGEKMTEDSLKHAVQLDETVQKAGEHYATCKRRVEILIETINALKLKVDLARSSETTRRLAEEPELNKK